MIFVILIFKIVNFCCFLFFIALGGNFLNFYPNFFKLFLSISFCP